MTAGSDAYLATVMAEAEIVDWINDELLTLAILANDREGNDDGLDRICEGQ